MVRDRLAEIKRNCDSVYNNKEKSVTIIDVKPNEIYQQIDDVLKEYAEIRYGITEIRQNIQAMRNLVAEISTTFRKNTNLPELMENTRQENMKLCQQIFIKIKDLEKDLPFKDDQSILSRIKRTNFYCIYDDFLNAWREHELFLVNYEEKIKKVLMRQAKLIDTNITEEETENLIENNTTSLFVGNILEDTEAARKHLRQLLVRHSELTKIERSITEVRDMFLRISTLVMEQNSLIQVIEYHAQQASVNVDKGNEELEKAREHKIKALKRKTCILVWVSIVLVILILIVIIF